MSQEVDRVLALLREAVDLTQEQQAELAFRVGQGELTHPVWSKDDGTITVLLLGEEGKTLGEEGDFRDLLQLIIDRWDENGGPDDGVEADYWAGTRMPSLQANISFGD